MLLEYLSNFIHSLNSNNYLRDFYKQLLALSKCNNVPRDENWISLHGTFHFEFIE